MRTPWPCCRTSTGSASQSADGSQGQSAIFQPRPMCAVGSGGYRQPAHAHTNSPLNFGVTDRDAGSMCPRAECARNLLLVHDRAVVAFDKQGDAAVLVDVLSPAERLVKTA